eukprot:tig00000350_g24322.t1
MPPKSTAKPPAAAASKRNAPDIRDQFQQKRPRQQEKSEKNLEPSKSVTAAAAVTSPTPRAEVKPNIVPTEVEEEELKTFDLTNAWGPCDGMTRQERFARAEKLGLDPPARIGALLKKYGSAADGCIWSDRV